MNIIKSFSIFIIAGLCELSGGYLIWQWLKSGKPLWFGIAGGAALALYGIIATWQTANFGKVYAAYGGIFVVMSIIWAWRIDGAKPDKFDVIGAIIVLTGVFVMFYMPKK